MPKTFSRKTTIVKRKRKPTTTRRRFYKARPLMRRPLRTLRTGFPDKLFATLKYTEQVNMDTFVTGVTYQVFNGNNAWDPYYSSGGKSSNEYGIYRGIYRYAKVIASSIKVNFTQTGAANIECFVLPSAVLLDSTIGSDQIASMRYSKVSRPLLGFDQGEKRMVTMYHYMRTNKLYGIPSLKYTPIDFSLDHNASSNVVPRPWYWNIGCWLLRSTDMSATAVTARVTISYKVVFFSKYLQDQTAVTGDIDPTLSIPFKDTELGD